MKETIFISMRLNIVCKTSQTLKNSGKAIHNLNKDYGKQNLHMYTNYGCELQL